jgi:orotate phosphoribosyltransferase
LKERLREILLQKSVSRGRVFTLASGKTSDFYVDARVTTLDAEGAALCGGIFFQMLAEHEVDAVGGYAIGADPIVAAIAVISHQQGRPLPAFIIRKEEKGHGTRKTIEGNFRAGLRVALFDDVITSGGSIIKGIRQVEAEGGKVEVVMAVLDRQEGGREAIEALGCRFRPIFTKQDLL